MNKVLGFVSICFIFFAIFSCRNPGKKVERFKDGTIAIVYDFPNMSDTSTYTYIENYPNGKIHKKFTVEKNIIVGPEVKLPIAVTVDQQSREVIKVEYAISTKFSFDK